LLTAGLRPLLCGPRRVIQIVVITDQYKFNISRIVEWW
jgi:hypothetical protein